MSSTATGNNLLAHLTNSSLNQRSVHYKQAQHKSDTDASKPLVKDPYLQHVSTTVPGHAPARVLALVFPLRRKMLPVALAPGDPSTFIEGDASSWGRPGDPDRWADLAIRVHTLASPALPGAPPVGPLPSSGFATSSTTLCFRRRIPRS